jgi:hypothetical protein
MVERTFTIGYVKRYVAEHCPHIKLTWKADWDEFRIAYKGLLPEREEAMAAYVSVSTYDPEARRGDLEEVIGTAEAMEEGYIYQVFNCDKLPATLQAEAR